MIAVADFMTILAAAAGVFATGFAAGVTRAWIRRIVSVA